MSEPTPRQVLYALVAAGILVVVSILVIGAGVAGLVPGWWTALACLLVLAAVTWGFFNWRRTAPLLALSIALFATWVAVTLLVA